MKHPVAVQENGGSVPNIVGDRLPYRIDANADAIVVYIDVDSDGSRLSDLALDLTKAIAERTDLDTEMSLELNALLQRDPSRIVGNLDDSNVFEASGSFHGFSTFLGSLMALKHEVCRKCSYVEMHAYLLLVIY